MTAENDTAADTVLPPSHYIERVCLATDEVIDDEIRPEELLVSSHRDGHPVDVYTRVVMSWLVDNTGRETLVKEVMRDVRKLGYKTADTIASLLGLEDSKGVASKLFGIRRQEHFLPDERAGQPDRIPTVAASSQGGGAGLARSSDGKPLHIDLAARTLLTGPPTNAPVECPGAALVGSWTVRAPGGWVTSV